MPEVPSVRTKTRRTVALDDDDEMVVVVTGVDISFDEVFGLVFKVAIASLLVGLILSIPFWMLWTWITSL
jgi:hypothetical protein